MAWNEPGNGSGKDKDPWGQRNDNQGPPDLDEVFKNIQDKINGLFGGGSSGHGGGIIIAIAIAIAIALYAYSGFYIVKEGNEAVVLRFGEYHETTKPGLRWAPKFIDTVEMVDIANVRYQEIGFKTQGSGKVSPVESEALMLTKDENIIDVKLTVQYVASNSKDFALNVRNPDKTLKEVTESALREVVGNSNMDQVLTEGRVEIAQKTKEKIQATLDIYGTGIIINAVNFQDVQPPEQVQDAFADAIKAREDKERKINQANAYKNQILPRAKGESARVTQDAEGYKAQVIESAQGEADRFTALLKEYQKAPEVTRERIYLSAMEEVLNNSSKVMIDADDGNNLFYIPLEKSDATAPTAKGIDKILSKVAAPAATYSQNNSTNYGSNGYSRSRESRGRERRQR
ncbi:MAG: FtsH protease activity modulator HflK [Gammaproteobacteria bacterium]|nr:MAG: FtsH protease activity modulator HflK [Gammaproteobacteria bacterium]